VRRRVGSVRALAELGLCQARALARPSERQLDRTSPETGTSIVRPPTFESNPLRSGGACPGREVSLQPPRQSLPARLGEMSSPGSAKSGIPDNRGTPPRLLAYFRLALARPGMTFSLLALAEGKHDHPRKIYPEGRWDDPIAPGTLPDLLSKAATEIRRAASDRISRPPDQHTELEAMAEVSRRRSCGRLRQQPFGGAVPRQFAGPSGETSSAR